MGRACSTLQQPVLLRRLFVQKTLCQFRQLMGVIEGVLELQAQRKAISLAATVAYLSKKEGVIPFHLHCSVERNGPVGDECHAAIGIIRDPTEKLGLALA